MPSFTRNDQHLPRDCKDWDCPRYGCRQYHEGYDAGFDAGSASSFAEGEAAGYVAGYQAAARG